MLKSSLVSVLLGFSACQQNKEVVSPTTATATNQADARADDQADGMYKKDKTGQYVPKSKQVTGYEDGRERPTRPKYDILPGDGMIAFIPPPDDEPCGGEYNPCPTGTNTTFISSVGIGAFSGNPNGYIYALRIISGTNSSITPSNGHIKIASDLNKGAGGKYVYLTFTRNPQYSTEALPYVPTRTYGYHEPITKIDTEAHTQLGVINEGPPGSKYRYMFKFYDDTQQSNAQAADLNEGAGGRYIFGLVSRDTFFGGPIKEVAILSGTSSSIQPPNSTWYKVGRNLNEGAGGYYIYFCYRK